ncbi:hypothetical protein CgunFtcFv8_019462 [Champsocephalus gunnari]|uniref:Uncharacterized protein n=1 Tax=Champsocephalus gunnari TaxID=52237 RepID=A0AAN8DJG0_CHAGU|nr:hypothetical protein CgunFtcFv8_019462 [Champsocephalus gunnari]
MLYPCVVGPRSLPVPSVKTSPGVAPSLPLQLLLSPHPLYLPPLFPPPNDLLNQHTPACLSNRQNRCSSNDLTSPTFPPLQP